MTVRLQSGDIRLSKEASIFLSPLEDDAFNPISMGFTHAYWTGGPRFAALGLADGAQVATFPDEVGSSDLVQGTAANRPTYRAASATWNNMPMVDFVDTSDILSTGAFVEGSLSQPNEIVMIGRRKAGNAENRSWFNSPGGWHLFETNTSGVPYTYAGGGSPTGPVIGTSPVFVDVLFNRADSFIAVNGTSGAVGPDVGTSAMGGLYLGNSPFSNTWNHPQLDVIFFGIKNGTFSPAERASLLAWSQEIYGTP